MPGSMAEMAQVALQGLALFGAIALLLTFFVVGLLVRVGKASEKGRGKDEISKEINRQFLIFGAVLVVVMGLSSLGAPLPIAFGAAFAVLFLVYRWIFIGTAAFTSVLYIVHLLLG